MRRFSFDIICKFSFEIDTECFIPSFSESKLADTAHMETKAITKHCFREKVEGSDRSGGQYGHGDVRTEEEGDGNDDDES
ncbi:hypothetical protein AHAS_Ahas10G0155600 [Arachis hypogaea]